MPAPRVIVLGSVNVDLVVRSSKIPQAGETVLGGEFYQAHGGKGANQAVAAARASKSPVVFIAAVGNDEFGRQTLTQFGRENLDCRYVKSIADTPTGVAIIMVDEAGENLISVASGANSSLSPVDLEAVEESIFEQASVFVACLESPLETVAAALRRAKRHGLVTILNPAPAVGELIASGILEFVDVLTPNEHEAHALTGIDTSDESGAVLAANRLRELGCQSVIVTRGAQGCVVVDSDGNESVPAHVIEAVDSTAAGDAFNGAIAVALADGRTLVEATRWAAAAAAISVTRKGAQPSLPQRHEIEQFPG